MHLSVATVFCFLALVLGVTAQFSYWLDDSCLHYPLPMGQELSLRPYLEEMFSMARLAHARMNKDKASKDLRDTEFRRMYRHIFKTDMDPDSKRKYEWGLEYKEFWGIDDGSAEARDTAFNIVGETLERISNIWTETDQRLDADQRVYCDNGQHFDEIKDGHYIDTINNVFAGGSCDAEGADVYAFVTCEKHDEDYEQENEPCLMTICDKAMQSFRYPGMDDWTNVDKPFLLSELLKDDKVTAGFTFDEQAGFASLLLHEWSHSQPHLTEDWFTGDNEDTGATAEWKCIIDIPSTARAVICAEAISYIGLAALLIEGKPNSDDFYSLQFDYETLSNKQRPAIAKFSAKSD